MRRGGGGGGGDRRLWSQMGKHVPIGCRYEKLAEQEELNYQQQRRRLFAEIEQEKERLAQQNLQERTQLDRELLESKVIYIH